LWVIFFDLPNLALVEWFDRLAACQVIYRVFVECAANGTCGLSMYLLAYGVVEMYVLSVPVWTKAKRDAVITGYVPIIQIIIVTLCAHHTTPTTAFGQRMFFARYLLDSNSPRPKQTIGLIVMVRFESFHLAFLFCVRSANLSEGNDLEAIGKVGS
jgi:hypothetical protein